MTNSLRVALVQHACGDDLAANMERSLAGIREAAERGAKLVMLQELHRSRYFPQHENPELFDLAEPIPGPSTEALAQAAKEHGIVVVGSLFERRAPGLHHNTAVVLDSDGSLAGTYRKMHIPDDPGFYEKYYFAPGDMGFEPIQTSVGKLGVLICWDQWFPEAARLMSMAGAEILLYPTAIGWDSRDTDDEQARQRDAWITIQRAHGVANGLPVLAGNRVGHEPDPTGSTPGIDFWGSSFVAGPQGEILALASTDEEQVLIADVDKARTENVRRIWPYLRDRRVDAYQDLLRLYRD